MENNKKGIGIFIAAILVISVFAAMPFPASASATDITPENRGAMDSMSKVLGASVDEDYYVYWTYYPDYTGSVLGACGGYVDASDNEYIYFWDNTGTAYKVKVETAGDPQQHPNHSDPAHVGPVTTRTFTLISSHNCIGDMGVPFYVCDVDEFHVDDSGIYLGPGTNGIWKWTHDWSSPTQIAPKLVGAQSLAYNPDTKTWYSGHWNRSIYALSDTDSDGSYMDETWTHIFTHPDYAGSHHDGMEYVRNATDPVNSYLWISDMTSDKLAQWHFGDHDKDPSTPDQWYEKNLFNYTHASVVEGMGFGPNQHFWITGFTSTTIYEIGGGEVQKVIPIQTPVPIKEAVPALTPIGLIALVGLLSVIAAISIGIRKKR